MERSDELRIKSTCDRSKQRISFGFRNIKEARGAVHLRSDHGL